MFVLRLLLTSFVISFALLTATHAAAEEVVVHEQLGVWEDPFHRRSPNFVIDNAESLFKPRENNYVGYSQSAWWQRIALHNPSDAQKETYVFQPRFDGQAARAYTLENGVLSEQAGGGQVPREQRTGMAPFPAFTYLLAPGERLEIFLKQTSDYAPIRLDYVVLDRPGALLYSLKKVGLATFASTFLLSLLLASLMQIFGTHKKLFALYSAFLLSSLAFSLVNGGFAAYFSWLDNQTINYLFIFGVLLYLFFSLMLHELFHDLNSAWIDFITLGLNFTVFSASMGAMLVDSSFGFVMFSKWGGAIVINGAITLVFLIAYQKKHPSASLAALGWTGFLIGSVLTTLTLQGTLGPEFLSSIVIGIVFEGLVFTLVVASRVQQDYAENEYKIKEQIKFERTNQLALIGELAATVTHEIKQPLSAMKLMIANLKNAARKSPEKVLEILPDKLLQLEALADRTAELSDQVRRSSRLSVDSASGASIQKSLEGCRLVLDPDLRHLKIELKLEIDPDLPNVAIVPLRLDQVFINIIGNAKDAIESSAPEERWIQIRATRIRYRLVRVTIEDSAGGIPSNHLQEIFDKYFTSKGEDLGTGLGLSICREIVEREGGNITAENTAHGARFTLMLPTAQSPLE